MPELPEVETLRRQLVLAINNRTIESTDIKFFGSISPLKPAEFKKRISNKKVVNVKRRAKVLIIELTGGLFLLIHLKMTGQLIFQPKSGRVVIGGHPQKGGDQGLPNKFTRVIIRFKDGSNLFFNDLRKFGWMKLIDKNELNKIDQGFGIEPLSAGFTLKKFEEILNKHKNRGIKQNLLDQKLIAGIGNIYADESCFCAGILPFRLTKKFNSAEVKKLYKCIIKILKLAVSKKGTSADTYLHLDGRPGGMAPYLKVYGRNDQRCRCCGSKIIKIKLNGRGTHFCNKCQQ